MSNMFCFQCEQTAGGKSCAGTRGVCGKTEDVANLQDRLTAALIGLSMAEGEKAPTPESAALMMEALFATMTNVNFDGMAIEAYIARAAGLRAKVADGPGAVADQAPEDLDFLWRSEEEIRALKSLILFGIRGVAAYAWHARVLGYVDDEVNGFFAKALRAIGDLNADGETLLPLTLETGRINIRCMELLDKAHTDSYGIPAPTAVTMTVKPGPFIIVSGHDLHDLKILLEQTDGKGVDIYTHGEMLPAHAYPALKKHSQLKGHFGTAWQNQQKEFEGVPAAILFTTNCLMPVLDGYRDKVFTTAAVGYPGLAHIGGGGAKDFSPVIAKALAAGGYAEEKVFTGINGGGTLTTGFGHGAVLGAAEQIIAGVKEGAIRHFFLVGGCDGAKTGRNYFTEFVKQTPKDSFILTLACGKFRFNDLDMGTLLGLPRILDMGQCNDAFAAVKVALALADAFGVGISELPLTLVLSWYEQKAVAILLSLLHLGIRNIRLGPSLPAFASPGVVKLLTEEFGLAPISTPEEDLQAILGAAS